MAKRIGGALRVHHTATSEATWDGPANESRLRKGEDEGYYSSAHAWHGEGSASLMHHEVSGDGEVGPANLKACRSGIELLNGADIWKPPSDRQGVYNHLAEHMRDGGVEPPELRKLGPKGTSKNGLEQRAYAFELRKLTMPEADTPAALEGYAAVFDVETILLPRNAFFNGSPEIREVIEKGAFTKTLRETDQRAVWNHNTDIVLGRRSNKTLTLRQDEAGLAVEILPPNTSLIRDMVLAPIERGDVGQMSFGFWSLDDEFEEVDEDTILIHQKEISLMEVSPVAMPAYSETSISSRCYGRVEEFWQRRQAAVAEAAQAATTNTDDDEAGAVEPGPIPDHPEASGPVSDHLAEEQTVREQIEHERVRSEMSQRKQ